MNAFVLAAIFISSPPEPVYNVSVSIFRGDPLGSVAEKNVTLMNHTSLSLPDANASGVPTTGVVYLTDAKDMPCLGITLMSVNDKKVKLECSHTFNDPYATTAAFPT